VWDFPETPAGPLRAIALVPRDRAPASRFPLLVALHGSGESRRGVERGAWGWARDYQLGECDQALRRPARLPQLLGSMVTEARLRALRRELVRQAYRGLVLVTPYTPDLLASLQDLGSASHQAYDAWLAGALVDRARAELPVLSDRESTGIDGVSLGGLHALWTGLGHPDVFGAVGALQPAVHLRQEQLADRYVGGVARPPQKIRLVTSDADPLRPDVQAMERTLRARGIPHEFRMLTGPHDYAFNRGPGGAEMLLFHDRALRGEASP
jgi:hypothetical protein